MFVPCVDPNQETQINFGGSIFDEKRNEVYFLAGKDRSSKYPTECIYEKTNGPNVLKFCILKITEFLVLFDWIKQMPCWKSSKDHLQ